MYIDKDSGGRYQLADLTESELQTIYLALKSHQRRLIDCTSNDGKVVCECERQFKTAGKILRIIERK